MSLANNVSFIDNIIEDTPDKYENLIRSRITSKQLKLTLQRYENLQSQYAMLIKNTIQTKNYNRWVELKDQNYMYGMVDRSGNSTIDFKFLGKTDSLDECKLKSIEDKQNIYSSIVYNTSAIKGDFSKSCYGSIKGRRQNKHTEIGVITSFAPNKNTRLGGSEGEAMLKEMTQLQEEIKILIKRLEEINTSLKKTKSVINTNKTGITIGMDTLLERLNQDRVEINQLLTQPDESAAAEDSSIQQVAHYSSYMVWVTLVLISLLLASQLYFSDTNDISIYIYIFTISWLVILGSYYYNQIIYYGGEIKLYISNIFTNIPLI